MSKGFHKMSFCIQSREAYVLYFLFTVFSVDKIFSVSTGDCILKNQAKMNHFKIVRTSVFT